MPRSRLSRWPGPVVTWHLLNSPPRIPKDMVQTSYVLACAKWNAVLHGLRLEYCANPANANIVVSFGKLGPAPGGRVMLAASGHPSEGRNQIEQIFNARVMWGLAGVCSGRFDLHSTVLHELGHSLGLREHLPPGNIFAEEYEGITQLQPGDIEAIQRLYPIIAACEH